MKSIQEYLSLAELIAPSLATAAAMAIGGSQVGTFVLLRRESMLALALPQVVMVGVALSLRWGLAERGDHGDWPQWAAVAPPLAMAALAVVLLAWSRRRAANHWLLPSLFVAGMSLSFLIIANAGAHVEEMQQRFTGSDVTVSAGMAALVVPIILAAGIATSLCWRRWMVMAQIPAAAELAGRHPARWDLAFLCLLATIVLLGTSALGAVMVLAMLFLPPAIVLPWARRIPRALWAAAIVACAALLMGFVLSNEMNWPMSQSVGGAGFAGLMVSSGLRELRRRTRSSDR